MISEKVRRACRAKARSQDGVLSRSQGLACGLTRSQWDRGAGGLLQALPLGCAVVVRGTGATATAKQVGRAALLSAGAPGAALCMGSTLRLNGVQGTPSDDPEHVLLQATGRHQRSGLVRHWFLVAPTDVETMRGIATVTLAVALIQVAGCYDDWHLLAVVDSVRYLNLLTADEYAAVVEKSPPRRQALLLKADGRRESPFESRAWLLMDRGGIVAVPQVTVTLAGFGQARLDFLVDDWVVVECDGRAVHDDIPTRYADRERHEALERAGYIVVRITWSDVIRDPERTLARIRSAITDARARHAVAAE